MAISRLRSSDSWEEYVRVRIFAEKTDHSTEKDYHASVREKLSSASDLHKWWSTLRNAVFDTQPSIPPLLASSGELVTRPVDEANLLMPYFDSKISQGELQFDHTSSVTSRKLRGCGLLSTHMVGRIQLACSHCS